MIGRTIEISERASHLRFRKGRLAIYQDDVEVGSVPGEDIALLMCDQRENLYSHKALTSLAAEGATVIFCGENHLPTAMLLPLSDHSEIVWRLETQMAVKKPVKKRLWQQLIREKIRRQAENLPINHQARNKLLAIAGSVRSGDPGNAEAQAARAYWPVWAGDPDFRRDKDAGGINGMLNYGYAVIRASIARAIVSAGLMPALGIHHRNRSNAFCLADDLIEPFRPLVDRAVAGLVREGAKEVSPQVKRALLALPATTVETNDQKGPLMVHLSRMTASLVRCYQGEAGTLEIPKPCEGSESQ